MKKSKKQKVSARSAVAIGVFGARWLRRNYAAEEPRNEQDRGAQGDTHPVSTHSLQTSG